MEKYLEEIFKHLNASYKSLESRLKAEGFKARVLQVLKAWEEWLVYDHDFINKLKTIFLGIQHVSDIEYFFYTLHKITTVLIKIKHKHFFFFLN